MLFAGVAAAEEYSEILAEDAKSESNYSAKLTDLANWCDDNKLVKESELLRTWLTPKDPTRLFLYVPDSLPERAELIASLNAEWRAKWDSLRKERAEELYKRSEELAEISKPHLAYRKLFEVLRENPDHENARLILGYKKVNGKWQRGPDKIVATRFRGNDPHFRGLNGELWRITSDTFVITGNADPERMKVLAIGLENLSLAWEQTFFDCWSTPQVLKKAFQEKIACTPRSSKKLVVNFFKDRDDYVSAMRVINPDAVAAVGYYAPNIKESFLFDADADQARLWWHEATHQLFQERIASKTTVGDKSNFWLLEGLALFMESLETREDFVTVGGHDASRMQFARFYLFNRQFFLPIESLAEFGQTKFQKDENVRLMYGQSGGVVNFLMFAEDGKWQPALFSLVRRVYIGKDQAGSLLELIEMEPEPFNKMYIESVRPKKEIFDQYHERIEQRTELSLAFSDIDNRTIEYLANAKKLVWLDLSQTKVTDEAISFLTGCQDLEQLFLSGTRITDKSMPDVGLLKNLKELDLSGTAITSDGLEQLSELAGLEELYLTNTKIDDRAIATLQRFQKLTKLDLKGTAVTPARETELRSQLKGLK